MKYSGSEVFEFDFEVDAINYVVSLIYTDLHFFCSRRMQSWLEELICFVSPKKKFQICKIAKRKIKKRCD